MRSMVSTAAFLLLKALHGPALRRASLALAAESTGLPQLFTRAIHIAWLGPGLMVAAVLVILTLMTRPSRKSRQQRRLVRIVRQPSLERYRGVFPKNHRDLEI